MPDIALQEEKNTPQEFPERGRVVAFLPSHEDRLPRVTNWRTHRKMKVHINGFHCDDARSLESRKKATGADTYTADVFVFRPRNKNNGARGGHWEEASKAEMDAFNNMPDHDVVLSRLLAHKDDVFTKDNNWGQRGRCELGDCIYATVMVYAPVEMFANDSVALQGRAKDV